MTTKYAVSVPDVHGRPPTMEHSREQICTGAISNLCLEICTGAISNLCVEKLNVERVLWYDIKRTIFIPLATGHFYHCLYICLEFKTMDGSTWKEYRQQGDIHTVFREIFTAVSISFLLLLHATIISQHNSTPQCKHLLYYVLSRKGDDIKY